MPQRKPQQSPNRHRKGDFIFPRPRPYPSPLRPLCLPSRRLPPAPSGWRPPFRGQCCPRTPPPRNSRPPPRAPAGRRRPSLGRGGRRGTGRRRRWELGTQAPKAVLSRGARVTRGWETNWAASAVLPGGGQPEVLEILLSPRYRAKTGHNNYD